jgi:hypothetical protein
VNVFEWAFQDEDFFQTETAVCCPFPHYTESGARYFEERPSMHVNVDKGVYHCKACGAKGGENAFVQALLGAPPKAAAKITRAIQKAPDIAAWSRARLLLSPTKEYFAGLGVPEILLKRLRVKTDPKNFEAVLFPLTHNGAVLDVRRYCPGGEPKMLSQKDAPQGLIWPYDEWMGTSGKRTTILCAGEKDAIVARSRGLNAITLTGGELAEPACMAAFQHRDVAICYDNDRAGKLGAVKTARALLGACRRVRVVTGLWDVCKEKGEDVTDFFVKYGKTKEDLVEIIKKTPAATESLLRLTEPPAQAFHEGGRGLPLLSLEQAASPAWTDKFVRSRVNVTSTTDAAFSCPSKAVITDGAGRARAWELRPDRPDWLLELVDAGITAKQCMEAIKRLAGVPDPKDARVEVTGRRTVYKASVTCLARENAPMDHEAYVFDAPLLAGKSYDVTHKLTPHPSKGQRLFMLITDARPAEESFDAFRVTERAKTMLRAWQGMPPSLQTKHLRGHIGYNADKLLVTVANLTWNTPLAFHYGYEKNIRGCLDTMVVGESRTGKSTTAAALKKLYGHGATASLAGSAATIGGLVGGSSKGTGDVYQTRAGVIPRNHRGLVVFEEFSKAGGGLAEQLTDVRSSGLVRLSRVAGSVTMPATLRMLTLTNPKTLNKTPRSIASYPNGLSIVQDLVGTPEDIARYDMIYIMPDITDADRGWSPMDGWDEYTEEHYRTRLMWVWSRTPEQIEFTKEAKAWIDAGVAELNKLFACHVKIFGMEAWKKLARLATAYAGTQASTDESFEKIIVTERHVGYATRLMRAVYEAPQWRLDAYAQSERLYTETDEKAVPALQDLYAKNPLFVEVMEAYADMTRSVLETATGLDRQELNAVLSRCVRMRFVKFSGQSIVPTERFRKTALRLDKDVGDGFANDAPMPLPLMPAC